MQTRKQLVDHLRKIDGIEYTFQIDQEDRVLWDRGVTIRMYWGDTYTFHYSESLLKTFPCDNPNWMTHHIASLEGKK